MNGFWGNNKSVLDAKGRINIPAKVRKNILPEDANTMIMIRGKGRFIRLYPYSSWTGFIASIKEKLGIGEKYRRYSRHLMRDSSEQILDKQGRLNLPTGLIDYAQLDGEVLIVGCEDWLEVWNPQNYLNYTDSNQSEIEEIEQELDL